MYPCMYSACSYVPMHVLVHHECTCQVAIGLRTEWGRSGSAVECRTLDRENPVMNPLHIYDGAFDGDTLWGQQNKILVLGNKL